MCEEDSLCVTHTSKKPQKSYPGLASQRGSLNLLMSVTIFTSGEVAPAGSRAAVLPAGSLWLSLTLKGNGVRKMSSMTASSFVPLVQVVQILPCINTANQENYHLPSESQRGRFHGIVLHCSFSWSFADYGLHRHFLILNRAGWSTFLYFLVKWIMSGMRFELGKSTWFGSTVEKWGITEQSCCTGLSWLGPVFVPVNEIERLANRCFFFKGFSPLISGNVKTEGTLGDDILMT